MEIVDKIVDFKKYCETCKYRELNAVCDPCDECLDNPTNMYTTRPVKYKEDEKLKNKKDNVEE